MAKNAITSPTLAEAIAPTRTRDAIVVKGLTWTPDLGR